MPEITRFSGLPATPSLDIQNTDEILKRYKKKSIKKIEFFWSKIDFEILDRKKIRRKKLKISNTKINENRKIEKIGKSKNRIFIDF